MKKCVLAGMSDPTWNGCCEPLVWWGVTVPRFFVRPISGIRELSWYAQLVPARDLATNTIFFLFSPSG